MITLMEDQAVEEGESYEVCATISNAMDPLQRSVSFALAIPEEFTSKNHRVTNLVSPRCNLSHCGMHRRRKRGGGAHQLYSLFP